MDAHRRVNMAAMATGETRAKAGVWTQHVDAATGRKYYFNMVQNRSYWELPEELLAQVKTPGIDALREWDPEAAARYGQPTQALTEEEMMLRRRREELVAAAMAAESGGATAAAGTLEERMALAAQRRTEEIKQSVVQHQQKPKDGEDAGDGNAYLKMVRELQAKDRDTEGSGGKWLVR